LEEKLSDFERKGNHWLEPPNQPAKTLN